MCRRGITGGCGAHQRFAVGLAWENLMLTKAEIAAAKQATFFLNTRWGYQDEHGKHHL